MFKYQEIVFSLGDTQIIGKDAICESIDIQQESNFDEVYYIGHEKPLMRPLNDLITITAVFKVKPDCLIYDLDFSKNKISLKKVKDCSIQELLFAIRTKLKTEVK